MAVRVSSQKRTLNLGTRTVHDNVMRLYEHFRVSSRAELLLISYAARRRRADGLSGGAL